MLYIHNVAMLITGSKFTNIREFSLAKKYVDATTKEYFALSSYQYSIPQNVNGNYDGILNDTGIAKYISINERVNSDHKAILEQYRYEYVNSGSWFPDQNSPWYSELKWIASLNTFNDVVLVGWYFDDFGLKIPIQTSRVVFRTRDWCCTQNNSIYLLKKYTSGLRIDDIISEYQERKK